jgi:hypothetical protein
MTFTRMQQFMIEDGFPPELILSDEQRKADWKGHHYTRQGSRFSTIGRLDPGEARQRRKVQREYDLHRERVREARKEREEEDREERLEKHFEKERRRHG